MNLRPLGDRVLIKPEAQPTTTASGLHLSEHWKPEQTGTVVAVGLQTHPKREEAMHIATLLEREFGDEYGDLVRSLVDREALVHPGDYVVFSWQVGQELFLNDGEERYLLMRESDILAVVDGV